MWSLEAWNEIQMFMPDNGNGSCVFVTTRLSNLAAHLNSSPFKMNFLDEDKSWELFCGVAFGEEKCPLKLEKIGKKIVGRCRGLPLSIIVIGGHLRKSTRAMEYWEEVASLMNPISSSVDDEQCLKIISLSYHHLPAYLKPCFLYMGIYREDEWMNASEFISLWIVEGFLKPKQPLSLEEVAEECLKDLSERNLILVREKNWKREVEYGIHDTVRELCLKLGKEEKFMCALEAIAIDKKHGIVMQPRKWKCGKFVGELKIKLSTRSSRCGECYSAGPWLDFRFMRCHFQLLNLHHFQFNLSRGDVIGNFRLLSSISLLWNVKTLIITHYHDDISVPYEIWEMPQLRHLEFSSICLPNPLPNQEECIVLQNLHTLLVVKDFKITEEVCKRMPNIKNLSVTYHHFPGDLEAACSYYCPHNLGRFSKLESLKCGFYGDDLEWNGFVLSFTFPSSLLKLTLFDSRLHWDDLTLMIKSLHQLEVLELFMVRGLEWNLVEEFPRLKKLKICLCSDLIYLNANSSHFPVLEILHIRWAPELSEIPSDIGEISTLECIALDRCSVSAAISAMRIVVEQESFGNQDLQLYVNFGDLEEKERFQKMVQEEGLGNNSLRLSPYYY